MNWKIFEVLEVLEEGLMKFLERFLSFKNFHQIMHNCFVNQTKAS